MNIELLYELVLQDRTGKVLSRKRGKSRSFVKAWLQLMFAQMTDVSSTIKDTGGFNRTSVNPHANNFAIAGAGMSYGLVFGTGSTPVTIEDFQMEVLIASGGGVGQMNYTYTEVSEPTIDGADCYFTVFRRAFNLSGGDITVAEWGVYVRFYTSNNYYMCGVRDVLDTPLLVPDDTILSGTYTLKITA